MSKTNAMRILDLKKIKYEEITYSSSLVNAIDIANTLNEDIKQVFKTLVTVSIKSKQYYVFVIPAFKELDLKKAAIVSKQKSIEMIHQKELLPLTGYIHGGCSPIGMKKVFNTFIDKSCLDFEDIFISGGKVGMQIKIKVNDLINVTSSTVADLTK